MEKLNLTPEEIYNTEFKVDLKGYAASEVDAFLDLILDDYQKTEENIQELLNMISSQQEKIKELNNQIVELESKQKTFDLSKTTTFTSVDLLKRVSRLEEEVYKK